MESRRDPQQLLALETVLIPYQVEGIWPQTQLLGAHL